MKTITVTKDIQVGNETVRSGAIADCDEECGSIVFRDPHMITGLPRGAKPAYDYTFVAAFRDHIVVE